WHMSQRYSDARNYQTAAVLMRRGLTVYGKRALNWAEYALVLRALGNMDGAVDVARRAVALDPELVAGRKVLAETLLATGHQKEASDHLRAVLEIDPQDVDAKRMLSGL
ncbi:MAG: tetratricopeptide repeat protein, partial [Candidatus Krumholzibacteria bacterium]|nr:tetratricopeptide repeat protein [Candidatus Krumholzibacteria bacterium]